MRLLLLSLLTSAALCAQSCNGNTPKSNVTEQSSTENVQPQDKVPEFSIKIKKYKKKKVLFFVKKSYYSSTTYYYFTYDW